MAFGYNQPTQNFNMNMPMTNQTQQSQLMGQNVQPLFPQPQGNVYNINSTLEVANVPVGAGISVALCLQEGYMYIKTMQNGNPLFWAYKITPFDTSKPAQEETQTQKKDEPASLVNLEEYDNRFEKLERQIEDLKKELKKKEEFKL